LTTGLIRRHRCLTFPTGRVPALSCSKPRPEPLKAAEPHEDGVMKTPLLRAAACVLAAPLAADHVFWYTAP